MSGSQTNKETSDFFKRYACDLLESSIDQICFDVVDSVTFKPETVFEKQEVEELIKDVLNNKVMTEAEKIIGDVSKMAGKLAERYIQNTEKVLQKKFTNEEVKLIAPNLSELDSMNTIKFNDVSTLDKTNSPDSQTSLDATLMKLRYENKIKELEMKIESLEREKNDKVIKSVQFINLTKMLKQKNEEIEQLYNELQKK